MTEVEKQKIFEQYSKNNMEKLRALSYSIFIKLGDIPQKDYDDFYSIANETLLKATDNFNENRGIPFDVFFRCCLQKKFKTEFRDRIRDKRKANHWKFVCYLDEPISENGQTIAEMLPDKSIEDVFFMENEDVLSDNMIVYLNRLSKEQKRILKMLAGGFKSDEIKEKLNISENTYINSILAIRSYRNISVLF